MNDTHLLAYSWSDIEKSLNTLHKVEGGFSHARRGIVTLPDGRKVFIKIGVDDNTKKWAAKEVETYQILAKYSYNHIPALLASNGDASAFALEPLTSVDNWDWTDTWTQERLAATIAAMDNLALLPLNSTERAYFAIKTIDEADDGWRQLAANPEAEQILLEKLTMADRQDIADALDMAQAAQESALFKFSQDTLVHNDVRADNCAWNAESQQVRLVDWNWAQLGDTRIDVGALLVNARKFGLDVAKHHAHRLHKDALHWLAGYWLNASTQPLWPGAPEDSKLRDYQLSSGIIALDLIQELPAR